MTTDDMKAECVRRDDAKVPLTPIAQMLGYTTWTEWAEAMCAPHPMFDGVKFIPHQPDLPLTPEDIV